MKTMKHIQRSALLLLFTLGCAITIQAQKPFRSEVIRFMGAERHLDLRDIVWKEYENAPSSKLRRIGSSSSDQQGVRWIDRINNLPEYMQTFHEEYGKKVAEVLNGGSNELSDHTLAMHFEDDNSYRMLMTSYTKKISFEFPANASEDVIAQCAWDVMGQVDNDTGSEINCFMPYLAISLSYDYPEAFWTANGYWWNYMWSFWYTYDDPSKGIGEIEYTIDIYYTLEIAGTYDQRCEEFQSGQLVMDAVVEFNQCVNDILANAPQNYRYNTIAYFNEWLTTHNSYSSAFGKVDNVPTIVWSALSALKGSTGDSGPVCEGYSRAFKVLCDKSNIPCILATGNAKVRRYDKGEAHMWNEVQMEDGKWYAVDVTWNDPSDSRNIAKSGHEGDFWLLLGKKTVVDNTNFSFAESHPHGIFWDVSAEYEQQWDYSVASLINDYRYSVATDITDVSTESSTQPVSIFSINGQQLSTPQKGVNIILMNNGQTRKILAK